MIITMSKIRVLGPRDHLEAVLRAVQDVGVVHLSSPTTEDALHPVAPTARQEREARHLQSSVDDVEWVLEQFERGQTALRQGPDAVTADFARWARHGRRIRRTLEDLAHREGRLDDERVLILKYRQFFQAYETLLVTETSWPNARAYYVVLRADDLDVVRRLRESLHETIGDQFELVTHRLPHGEVAVLLLVSTSVAERVEHLLAEARVQELPVPEGYGGGTLADAMPAMLTRLREIPAEAGRLQRERRALAREHRAEFARARAAMHDRLLELQAVCRAVETPRAFVIEGWLPVGAMDRLTGRIDHEFGAVVVVERVATEQWAGEDAPVVLSNPRLFRPFETLTRLLPLPKYGSIDPTPFVAVFFPMFFGVILGDIGYGVTLAALALVLHARSTPGRVVRSVSEIAGACAAFSIVFGALYGELFGDLGRRLVGLRPLAFNREEAVIPFLGLAVALGVVHVVLGLVLGMANTMRRDPRRSVGRGAAALMVLLVGVALLAAFEVFPEALLTPSVVLLLVLFPLLVLAEGIIAPLELLSTLGNILSYARIMAVGTASVTMAVVANRMVGTMGSAVVGILFALLFHLVNFGLGLFSPTIHALRLHYVEFFGTFYSPGGTRYVPFGHWHPSDGQRA